MELSNLILENQCSNLIVQYNYTEATPDSATLQIFNFFTGELITEEDVTQDINGDLEVEHDFPDAILRIKLTIDEPGEDPIEDEALIFAYCKHLCKIQKAITELMDKKKQEEDRNKMSVYESELSLHRLSYFYFQSSIYAFELGWYTNAERHFKHSKNLLK